MYYFVFIFSLELNLSEDVKLKDYLMKREMSSKKVVCFLLVCLNSTVDIR